MRDVAGVVVLVCAATGWGCRGETIEGAAQSLKGVYKIESYTLNKGSCDREGAPALDTLGDRFVFVFASHVMGTPVLTLLSCRDLATCREKARKQEEGAILSGDFAYSFTTLDSRGRLSSRYSSSGSASADKKSCTGGSASDHVLVHGEGKLRIEDRTRAAKDYPADDKGQCWTDKALAAAEGQACRQLTVYTAALQP